MSWDLIKEPWFTLLFAPLCAFLGALWSQRIARKEQHALTEEGRTNQADLEAKLKALQAELDMEKTKFSFAFEAKYGIYRELWVKLEIAYVKATELRWGFKPITHKNKDDQKQAEIQETAKALSEFITFVHNNRPFYSKEIYTHVINLFEPLKVEYINAITYENASQQSQMEQTDILSLKKRMDDTKPQYEKICELIQQEIGTAVASPTLYTETNL